MLISQLTNETDLAVANRITLAASDVSREKFHPRDLRRIQTWWQNHLNEYTNWPISDFQMGMQDFMSVNYVGAGEAFGRVLNLDQDADRVRAWLIVCNWEAGDTNKALVLAKSFKNADSRWQKFAAAKAELASGNVSNATSQLVSLLTNYPTMSGTFLGEGSHLWRNVDWPLFHRLNGDVPGVPGAIPLIVIDNTPLKMALSHLAKQAGLDVVIDEAISGNVSTRWENLTAKQAFDCLCETNHLIAFKDSATGVIQIRPKQ